MNTPNALSEFEPATLKPYYQNTCNGVFYIALETDKDGNTNEKPPMRLSDSITIIGARHG